MDNFNTACIQFDVKLGDISANVDYVRACIESLAKRDVVLSVLPEMWSCGFDNLNLRCHAEQTPHILETISRLAAQTGMVIAGSMPESDGKNIYNTLYVIDRDGSLAGAYRKVHLFKLTDEHRYYKSGNKNIVCQTRLGLLGLIICYDLRFPEMTRALTLKGAPIIIVSAQWPLIRIPHWNILIPARALENQVYMVATNRCGASAKLEYGGNSQIVAPTGAVLCRSDHDPSVIVAELNMNQLHEFRKTIPCLTDRIPEAYEL